MLTNLNWLAEGTAWPPPSEVERLNQYKENERLFLTEHNKVWAKAFRMFAEKYEKKNIDVDTITNYHQLLSKKTADFVCGEPPKIETEDDTDALMELLSNQEFFALLYEEFLDVSRYGNGVIKFVDKEASAVSPQNWFPIVDPTNLKKVRQHVLAYPTNSNAEGAMTELYVEIHSIGLIETRRYLYNAQDQHIGKMIYGPTAERTNLDVPAIQVLTNLTHSGSIYGVDDYNIINSIIRKLMWRLHCADTILDKHSEPSMTGPESALQYDEKTKLWYLPLGNYFKRVNNEDPQVGYVTWEGNLESNFKEIELLFNQIYILTEMGQAFADAGGDASDSSGTALKLRMVSPRIKAQRLVGINDAKIKTIISTLAKLNGIKLDSKTLKLYWNDGLPIDEVEQTSMLVSATGGKPIMSQYTAMKKRGLSDRDAEIELETIRNEEAESAPIVNVPKTVDVPDGEEE